jgi:hypothetical protein
MKRTESSTETDSMPTPVAVGSNCNKLNPGLRLLSDMTDDEGVRHVELQTTSTGDDLAGYELAEREAHSWFFAIYDPIAPGMNIHEATEWALDTTELGLSCGKLREEWLSCPHPVIRTCNGAFRFGHHVGINPTSPNGAWKFQFEVVPINLK